MLTHSHSRTAEATAAIRACHLRHDRPVLFADPYAQALTSPVWRQVCESRLLHWLLVRVLLRGLRPVHGWILVRDHLTERCLEQFVAAGNRQFVLLGAGFDSTALRRPPWLEGVHIIEVDHPATQAVKLERVKGLGGDRVARDFETVAIDFEQESLDAGLARSRFAPGEPALFAWQGVIYYLSAAAIRETLGHIARLAAPGSELLFDFLLPRHTLVRGSGRVQSFAQRFTARLGERYVSYHTPDEVCGLLADAGFDVVDIHLDEALEATYLADRDDGLTAMRGFGIAHARKP